MHLQIEAVGFPTFGHLLPRILSGYRSRTRGESPELLLTWAATQISTKHRLRTAVTPSCQKRRWLHRQLCKLRTEGPFLVRKCHPLDLTPT